MATPIRLKRSAVPGKRPVVNDLQLGELAFNFYDGYLWGKRDTGGVAIGTTIALLTPWTENFGAGSIYYLNSVGIGTTLSLAPLHVSGGAIFSGNNSSELVRITQTGSGPALVVEDSLNPDITPFVVTSAGKVGIGLTQGEIGAYALEVDGGNIRFVTGGQGDLVFSHQNLVSNINAADNIQLGLGANNQNAIRINLNNDVGIGTTTPTSKLHVVGNTFVTGISTFGDLKVNRNAAIDGHSNFVGVVTFAETIFAEKGAFIDNILIGVGDINKIYTNTGDLILDSDNNLVNIDSSLIVSGIATFSQLLDANNGVTIDNVQIGISGDNEIDTTVGNLTIDSADGTILIDDRLIVSGISTFNTNAKFIGNVEVNENIISTGVVTSFDRFSTGNFGTGINITQNTISGPSEITIDPAGVGDNTGSVRIKGDLFVDGVQTVINSTTVEIADFIVGIASTATTDVLADGAGIKIGPNNTLTYDHANTALKSSENFNLAVGKVYEIDGTEVLSSTLLTVANINSSGLTTTNNLNVTGVGTIATLNSTTTNITNANIVTGIVTNLTTSGIGTIATASIDLAYVKTGITTNLITTGIASITSGIVTNLTVSGVATFQSNIRLGDNDQIILGDDDDLKIYHDGTDSWIYEQGPGTLNLRSNGGNISLILNSQPMVVATENGSVQLYHGSSTKFETTGAGATVYGILNTSQLNVIGISTFTTINTNIGNIVTGVVTNLTTSGIGTITNLNATTGNIVTGIVTNLRTSGIGTITTLNATTGNIVTGVVTTLSGTTATYTTGNFDTANVTNAIVDIGVITTLSGVGATYITGNFTTVNTNIGNVVTGIVTNLRTSGIGTITTLNATTGNIVTGVVTTLSGTTATYTDASINTANIRTGIVTNFIVSGIATVSTASIDLAYVKTGIVTNLTTSGIGTITTLNAITGNIVTGLVTTLSGTTATYTTGNFGTANATTGNIVTGVVTTLSGTTATYTTGNFVTANTNIGNIVTGVVTNLITSGIGTITTLNATTGNIVTGVVTTLSGTTATYTTGNFTTANATTGNIVTGVVTNLITSGIGTITTLNATTGNIVTGLVTTLSGTTATYTTGNFVTANTNIGNIVTGVVTNLITSGIGTITTLNATTGNIVTGVVTNLITSGIGTITTLNATTGNIVTGVVTTLSGTNLNYTGISTLGITSTTNLTAQQLQVTGGAYVSGNLGVGTTNPTSKLDVVGNIKLTGQIQGPSELIIDPAAVGDNTGAVRIKGDLFVDGTQTIINSATIELADFIVGIASTATTDLLADGAGIKIGPDNTLTYDHANTALKSSENFNLAVGKSYEINGTEVLSSTLLTVANISASGIGTITNINVTNGNIVTGIVTNLITNGIGTITTLNATTGNIVTGIVTTLSGTTATYTNASIDRANIRTGIVTNLTTSGIGTITQVTL